MPFGFRARVIWLPRARVARASVLAQRVRPLRASRARRGGASLAFKVSQRWPLRRASVAGAALAIRAASENPSAAFGCYFGPPPPSLDHRTGSATARFSRALPRARRAYIARARAPRRGAGEGSRTGGASGNFLLPRRPLCPRRRSVRPSPRPPENSCSVAVRLSKRAAALGLALALASGMACVAAFAVDMVSCGSSRGGGGGAGGEDERPGLQAGGGGFTGFYITAADVQL